VDDTRPNVLFVLVDTLRADHTLGPGRSSRTPNLDALAERSTTFSKAFATASTTTISVASIFSGTYPFLHGVRALAGQRFPATIPTLAEAFRASGYHTWAEVTGPLVAATGLDRGFDRFEYRPYTAWLDTEFGARLRESLKNNVRRPWFGFLHLWEIHHPRRVTETFRDGAYGETLYARAVSSLDAQLGSLFGTLPENTAIVFTSDHGEYVSQSRVSELLTGAKGPAAWLKRRVPKVRKARKYVMNGIFRALDRLGRRDSDYYRAWLGHGFDVYDPLLHVPLLIHAPGRLPAGVEVDAVVGHVDIYPTLVSAFSLEGDTGLSHGVDLLPVAHGLYEAPLDRAVYLEACGARISHHPEQWLCGVRTARYKYIRGLTNRSLPRELYDLERDPHERHNIAAVEPERAEAMEARLASMSAQSASHSVEREAYSAEEMAEVEGRLRDLGYID
jgi:arylsulfatase A-like enzyme